MKHLNMFMAATALVVSASAYAQGYTVAPEPGVVDELASFSIIFDEDGLDEVELESSAVNVLKDGVLFSDVKKKGYGFDFTCTLNTPATEPGTYEVVIDPEGITYYSDDYSTVTFNEKAVSFSYTIKGGGETPVLGGITIDPAPGVVKELYSFSILFDETGLDEVELESSAVNVLKDGVLFSDVKKKGYGFDFTCTLNTPATEPGTYEVIIDPEGITYYSDDYATVTFNEKAISFTYTIEGGGEAPSLDGITVNPTPGVVDELTSFSILFDETGLDEVELESSAVNVLKDGVQFSDIKKKGYGFEFTCTLNTPATEPGTYEVVIDPEGITYYSDDYATVTFNEKAVSFTYVIEGSETPSLGACTVDPEPGVVEELETFVLSFDKTGLEDLDLESSAIHFLKDGEEYCEISKKGYGFRYTVGLEKAATEPGTYTLVIDEYGVTYYTAGSGDEYDQTSNTEPITFEYTIEGEVADNVVYDITFDKFRPAEGEVDLENVQFEGITMITSGTGLVVNAAAEPVVTVVSNNGYEATGKIKKNFENNFFAPIKMISRNGEYTVTIPEAAIVDEEYVASNGKSGHANAETTVVYTCVNGTPLGDPVVYDLNIASVTPAQGVRDLQMDAFSSISLSLPEGCAFRDDKFTLTMTAPEEQGDITLNFTSTTMGNLAFFDEPTHNGEYVLVVPKGTFGDQMWLSDSKSGHANEEVVLEWTLTGGIVTGVEVISTEELSGAVYTLDGILVADSIREVGAGLYIVNGKKVKVVK